MEKPISVQINDAKQNIVKCINDQRLHITLLEPVVKEIYEQVHVLAEQQYEKERYEYEQSLKEGEKDGME